MGLLALLTFLLVVGTSASPSLSPKEVFQKRIEEHSAHVDSLHSKLAVRAGMTLHKQDDYHGMMTVNKYADTPFSPLPSFFFPLF